MRPINYILVNETGNKTAVRVIANSPVSELRYHNVIINAVPGWKVAGSSASETLINELCRLRRHWPDAKILGLQEIDGKKIHPCNEMNRLRRELSNLS